MKPAPFKYAKVTTVDEALAALAEHGPDARILAGGQSLLQEMNLRQTRPACLIDINHVAALDHVTERDGTLAIGALTRHRAIERSEVVARLQPVLAEATRRMSHFQVRNRGTIGGALVQNSPGAEYPVVARLLDAEIDVAGPEGIRTVPAAEFFVSHYTTAVAAGEMVTEIRFPALPSGAVTAFDEVNLRHGHLPYVAAAAAVRLEGGVVQEARVALGNVSAAGVPCRVDAVSVLVGQPPSGEVLDAFERAVADEVRPDLAADERAAFVEGASRILSRRTMELVGEDYRKRAAGALARRTVERACAQSGR